MRAVVYPKGAAGGKATRRPAEAERRAGRSARQCDADETGPGRARGEQAWPGPGERSGSGHQAVSEDVGVGGEAVRAAVDRLEECLQVGQAGDRVGDGTADELVPGEDVVERRGGAVVEVRRGVAHTEQRRHVEALAAERYGAVVPDLQRVGRIDCPDILAELQEGAAHRVGDDLEPLVR